MPRQAVRLTKEATAGTFDASALSADKVYLRLDQGDSFAGRPTPDTYYIRDAAGSNRPVQADHATFTTAGSLNVLCYLSQAKNLIYWACNLVADGLHYKPPFTFTLDHMMQMEDSGRTRVYKRYLGCTPGRFRLAGNNQGDGQKMRISVDFLYRSVAAITVTDFATPALSAYPTDKPMQFKQLGGGLTVGSALTRFRSFELEVANKIEAIYDESTTGYPQEIGWYGRDVAATFEALFKSTAHRTAFDAVTAQTASAQFSDGTTTLLLNMYDTNIITAVDDLTPLDGPFYQRIKLLPMVDATSGTDLAATVTP